MGTSQETGRETGRRYKDGPLCCPGHAKWESKFLGSAAERLFHRFPFLPVFPNNGGSGSGREDVALDPPPPHTHLSEHLGNNQTQTDSSPSKPLPVAAAGPSPPPGDTRRRRSVLANNEEEEVRMNPGGTRGPCLLNPLTCQPISCQASANG